MDCVCCLLEGLALVVLSELLLLPGGEVGRELVCLRLRVEGLLAVDGDQLHIKVQISVGRNVRACPVGAVPELGGDVQYSPLAQRHLHDTLVPSLDDLADPNGELKLLAAVARAVELLAAVLEGSGVVLQGKTRTCKVKSRTIGKQAFSVPF